jgi:hypothetical protein
MQDMSRAMPLSLYVVDPVQPQQRAVFGTGDIDFGGPIIARMGTTSRWMLSYGVSRLTLHDLYGRSRERIQGQGNRQMAPALDPTQPTRVAFMDGSFVTGFNIRVQTGAQGTPINLTDDASATVSYWTPAFSSDGEWILYAKIMGDTGAEAELWRVRPSGADAEKLPITTVELPTYAVFNAEGTEVFVPGDFTSYLLSDGSAGTFDAVRDIPELHTQLAALGYEMVGSPLTGPLYAGGPTAGMRHTFPLSAHWPSPGSDRIYFDAVVASSIGPGPRPIEGVGIFSWKVGGKTLQRHVAPIPLAASRSDDWSVSLVRPYLIP